MSAELKRSPDAPPVAQTRAAPDDLSPSQPDADAPTLGALPLGARLILRCRKDWRAASVAAFEPDLARVVLSVASPSGHTYRVRRPADSPISLDGHIPVLGEGTSACWRAGLARYDTRW